MKAFIDAGWYTVPLKGKIKRLEDGSKTTPIFPKNWKTHYQQHFNEEATPLGGALTGAISGIIAIDCDNLTTLRIFEALHPDHPFQFRSNGKDGSTLIYRYREDLPHTFSIKSNSIALDIFSDQGFIYLPGPHNEAKEDWPYTTLEELPEIPEMPEQVAALIKQLHASTLKPKTEERIKPVAHANYLAPQVKQFISRDEFIPALFRIITPKDFRDLPQYQEYGYLHPNQVPEGRGSEYLSKISAILGADPSIDEELYTAAMYAINDLWEHPLPKNRLEQTIIKPMVSKQASIDGEPIWKYDPHWQHQKLSLSSKRGDYLEVIFDDNRVLYYVIDLANQQVKEFDKDTYLAMYLETVAIDCPPRKELKTVIPLVHVLSEPAQPFGFWQKDEYTRCFNKFSRTQALEVLNNPAVHEDKYQYPATTLKYFQTLVPDDESRQYMLSFLKRKLTTFEYSPVVLYFLGVPGSGKDTLVNLLAAIMGDDCIARPSTKEFLETHNGWAMDKYFVQLDEYGDQLSRQQDKDEAWGKLKAYTGKPTIQIRKMRSDGYIQQHRITFIMTANRNPLMVDADDRRLALFNTPNNLAVQDWVNEEGGIAAVISKIFREVNDFCYYLATEVDPLTHDDFVTPPVTAEKHRLVASMLPAAARLAYILRAGLHSMFRELIEETDCEHLIEERWHEGKVLESSLAAIYDMMTDGAGSKRGLNKVLSDAGFSKVPTTYQGAKDYLWYFPNLRGFKASPFKEY